MHTVPRCAGVVVVQVPKLTVGQHFPNLEMLTTLLPRKHKDLRSVGEKPQIEVLELEGGGAKEEEEEEEFDWEVEQTFPESAEVVAPCTAHQGWVDVLCIPYRTARS